MLAAAEKSDGLSLEGGGKEAGQKGRKIKAEN